MADHSIDVADVYPSATPTETEAAAWQSLDREEQVRRLQMLLAEARDSGKSPDSVEDVWQRALERAARKDA